MPRYAEEGWLLRARATKSGWGHSDLMKLYAAYGFTVRNGSKHDVVSHPEYTELRATVSRSTSLAKGYVAHAVKLIDEVLKRQQEEGE